MPATEAPLVGSPLPAGAGTSVIDFGATPDDDTDDTAAIQAALDADRDDAQTDYFGRPKTVVLPAGTYVVSDTLTWTGCCLSLRGDGPGQTVLKLVDDAAGFQDPAAPGAVISVPRLEGNNTYRQFVSGLTVDTGRSNPGAVGIDFITSGQGGIEDVVVRSADRSGRTGISMGRDWPGPAYLRRVRVDGFDTGIFIGTAQYGVVLDGIEIRQAGRAGLEVSDNVVTARDIAVTAREQAIRTSGLSYVTLLDAQFIAGARGLDAAATFRGHATVRKLDTFGYARAIDPESLGDPPNGSVIESWDTIQARSLLDPLRRPAEAVPIEFLPDRPVGAVPIEFTEPRFVPDQTSGTQASELQELANSGTETIWFGPGSSLWGDTITIPATVKHIYAFGHVLNEFDGTGLVFNVNEASDEPLVIDGFGYGLNVRSSADRPVVLRRGAYRYSAGVPAELFLEGVRLDAQLEVLPGQRVHAVGIDARDSGPEPLLVNAGVLGILGLHTAGVSPVLQASEGSHTEIWSGLIYPAATFPVDAATSSFTVFDADAAIRWVVRDYTNRGAHPVQVEQTRGVTRRTIEASELSDVPIVFQGYAP